MEVKPGYKQTEAGVIPKEWEIAPISSVVSDFRGGASLTPTDFTNSGVKVLPKRGVIRGGYLQINNEDLQFCTQAYANSHPRNLVDRDYIIVVLRDLVPSGPSIGLMVQIKNDETYLLAQGVYGLKVDEHLSIPAYLVQVSNTFWYRRLVNGIMVGSTQVHITNTAFKKAQIPFPPLAEQRVIAGALGDMDALIDALEKLITKKRDIKQAVMLRLLTGHRRLPGFDGQWESQTIDQLEKSKLVELARGKVISQKDIDRTPGDYPIYSASVKWDGVFGRYGEFMFDEELITWSVDGGGNFFYRPKHKFSVTNVCGLMRVDTSKISYRFLAAQLQLLHSRKSFDYLIKAHPSVIRKAYEVSLPQLDEQIAIATVLTDMDAEVVALEQRLAKTRALKQGMMQELLTGRTRLV